MNFRTTSQLKRRLSGYVLALLLVFSCLIVHAQQQKVLQVEKGSLERAIEKIRAAYNVVIAYNKNDVTSLEVKAVEYKDQTVEQVLNEILKGTNLSFRKNGTSY